MADPGDPAYFSENWFPTREATEPPRANRPKPLRIPLRGSGSHGFRLMPVEQHEFQVGPHAVPLLSAGVVSEHDVDYDADAGRDATGAILWPASTLVVNLMLETFAPVTGRAVLELGCGHGFCGLVARRLSTSRVVLSDRDPTMRALAARNSERQPLPVDAIEDYGWGEGDAWPAERGAFGLIVASDVIYNQAPRLEPCMLTRFAALLDWSLDANGIAIVGFVERNERGLDDVVAALRPSFVVTVLSASECAPREPLGAASTLGLRRCQVLWRCRVTFNVADVTVMVRVAVAPAHPSTMGDMWRSQKMQLVQMIVQNDAAHAVVNKLGTVGLLQFRDLNAGTSFYKRSFVEEVRKCDDLARIMRGIQDEFESAKIELADKDDKDSLKLTLEDVESKIRGIDDELAELKEQQELLCKNDNALREQKLVLTLGKKIYTSSSDFVALQEQSASYTKSTVAELMALSEFAGSSSSLLGQVSGVIKAELVNSLERTVFRATRGNAVFKTIEIAEPLLDVDSKGSPEPVTKTFFMVLFAGEVMREKISKICSYFGASLYKFPEGGDDYTAMFSEVDRRLEESDAIISKGQAIMADTLGAVAKTFATWNFVVQKEKMVFDTLNMCEFDIKRHVFVAEGWVPTRQYEEVVLALQEATVECGLDTRPIINKLDSTKTKLTPPTYIPVTLFTSGFQALVNTYGTPRYREANPGAFCCIFFPFLFGIMFGDFGHGTMLAMFGYFLISKEKDWGSGAGLNDMVQMCYGGRYIILLNGIFGAYVGFLYNEAFAFPMNWFGGSRWYNAEDPSEPCEIGEDGSIPTCAMDAPYPVGIDPIWHYTANKITFFNSFKMKISIVVGVIQMTVGICLSLLNHLEYKDYKRVFFEYLPEMIFFEGIFGYLVFTIFWKWSIDWNGDVGVPGNPGPQVAPSLLTLLINMFMAPTSPISEPLYGIECYTDCAAAAGSCGVSTIAAACPKTCGGGDDDFLTPGGGGKNELKVCFSDMQSSIQFSLLIAAFVAVPFLLIPIPFIELAEHNAEMAQKAQYEHLEEEKHAEAEEGDDDGHGEFSFGDAFIHQAIHTIEFVLGSISNTASYLRLWALSLAHSQLAELFKDMILRDIGLTNGLPAPLNGLAAWFAYAAWAIISLVVLMVMENLSSFLHALRLQWVEFQNKFFYGDGHKYTPFSFESITAVEEAE